MKLNKLLKLLDFEETNNLSLCDAYIKITTKYEYYLTRCELSKLSSLKKYYYDKNNIYSHIMIIESDRYSDIELVNLLQNYFKKDMFLYENRNYHITFKKFLISEKL